MRDNMYENRWSPFDPKWYKEAFDKFISTADQLFNTDLLIKQGYHIPDVDGSRSSVFRNEAILNNSFNEDKLRDTLKDIYLNSSHKLIASNHDNTHFYQWYGYMSDMTLIPNTNLCEIKLPTDGFIYPNERDEYKLSQMYRKWIKVEDILNNWDIFKWHCMLFINQRIYSEYEMRIDDHETTIRFRYFDHWLVDNYPVYVYRMDTNAQCRILISRELCKRQWDWKIPLKYIDNQRISTSTNIIAAFNKTSDQNIRKDGLTNIDVLGDNIEFLEIKDGFIDLSNISKFNRIYIESEATEYLWMSIIVPKFFHEYPILLPTDVIFRPYEANFQPVVTIDHEVVQHVKGKHGTNNQDRQVYVDLNGHLKDDYNGWKQMIRPIVLSDAFDGDHKEPYDGLEIEIDNLRDLTVKGADIIEDFRFFLKEYNISIDDFNDYLQKILNIMHSIREAHNSFLDHMLIEYNQEYERRYKKFQRIMNDIKVEGIDSEWLKEKAPEEETEDNDFWFMISPLIYIPRELADKYYIIDIIAGMSDKTLWPNNDQYLNQTRFQRPIDESDFWTFEYYPDDQVWRPYNLSISRKFPDVYLPTDTNEEVPSLNRVFKAFFFYSDTINVLDESNKIVRATASWDNDVEEYHFDQAGVYRDIFMEKFYWMGVRSIYKGLLTTHNRWEAIEYIIDNDSYDRFNELFMKTMDPYFKLGLATYLKSSNYGFPFDDAIDKLEESINTNWLGYKKITNFEVYLNNTWIPSYFDYITKIMDDWDYANRLIRRPRSTFDIKRLLPILNEIQTTMYEAITELKEIIDWLLEQLEEENYNLNIENFRELQQLVDKLYDNICEIIEFTDTLDLHIYSIDDINHIVNMLNKHKSIIDDITHLFENILTDTKSNDIYNDKREILKYIDARVNNLPDCVSKIVAMVHDFDMDSFMKAINDLRSYFDYAKTNPDDNSLIGHINKFDDPWSKDVKEKRNKLFQSTAILYGNYEPDKIYVNEEVTEFISMISNVKNDIHNLRESMMRFWDTFKYDKDQVAIDKLDYTEEFISELIVSITEYINKREELLVEYREIIRLIGLIREKYLGNTEDNYLQLILKELTNMVNAVSHLSGKDNEQDAINAIDSIKFYLIKLFMFNEHEEEVFNMIYRISEPPIKLLDLLHNQFDIIDAIIDYINTVNIKFVPLTTFPTYSDVYSVDEIEIETGGFRHEIGDEVFIPSIGSYKITSINGKVSTATCIENLGYRATTFSNPMLQPKIYDSITNGNGMGITIRPTKVNHQVIVNDEPINQIIMRIRNATYIVTRDSEGVNPHWNIDLNNDIDIIRDIKTSWDEIISKYESYLSDEMKNYATRLMDALISIIGPCERFIEFRDRIKVTELVDELEQFIFNAYECIEQIGAQDEKFFYYDDLIRNSFNSIKRFYDNGATWSDGDTLNELMIDLFNQLDLYKKNVLNKHPEETKELINDIDELTDSINVMRTTIDGIPYFKVDLTTAVNKVNQLILVAPSLKKDVWFKIKSVGIAAPGKGYSVGDIIEIVPKLPRDPEGNDIHDDEDLIMSDVILLKVGSVNNGAVTHLDPLMDYAVPYSIWGIRDTVSRVGNGDGLKVDVVSFEIQLSDSTIFRNPDSDDEKPDMFDEHDMFMFKFENIHDLDVKYEVFLGGKQITDFYHKHELSNNPLHPSKIDVLYINANDVMRLQNSSIFIPEEHYFIYKIDNITIKDPGAGYAKGQDIVVDTEQLALRLKVAELEYSPFKGIEEVEISDASNRYKYADPSCENSKVVCDSFNNIDDEYNNGYYDKLTPDGIIKPATRSYSGYDFISKRFDNLEDGDRNKSFMYPCISHPTHDIPLNGDPDYNWYLGSRIDNSQHPMTDNNRWNGIINLNPPTDPFIPDKLRLPDNQPATGEYQLISRMRLHNTSMELNNNVTSKHDGSIRNAALVAGDLVVPYFRNLPRHKEDYPQGGVGKNVIVEWDETHGGHRMLYKIRTFIAAGFFVYELPQYADEKWDNFNINWMEQDWYPDMPTQTAQYPSAPWRDAQTFREIQHKITDGKIENEVPITDINMTTYIHNLTINDLSLFNWTTKRWEDLNDTSRWKIEVRNDPRNEDWGFKLTLLEEGTYSYDMMLYLNKVPDTQMRNSLLKRDAVMDISAVISKEVNTPAINSIVNTGRHLRIRKLFPYEQKESYVIGKSENGDPLGYEMNFKVSKYMYYRNEIHLEDIKVFNKSAGRFENILDRQMFEVRFKDSKAISRGKETQTVILQSMIGNPGEGFVDGQVWGWNEEFGIHIFGDVTADFKTDGHILTFRPIHCPNPPKDSISLEFHVFQHDTQSEMQMAVVMIEFHTQEIEVWGDGYIHNVTNKLAPVPEEFKVIVQYDLDGPTEYDIIISKTPRTWVFTNPEWEMNPTFHLDKYNIQADRLYILTDRGRFPIINPGTNKPSMQVVETENGTDVTFLNLYRRYENLTVCSTPYPMRSVYVQRKIPSHGYINLKGKINKPLNKKYFEFWVNGKLLLDEVTIITPTKIFLHGLKSLKNLEIIEVNRDSNEYFSDSFLDVTQSKYGRPYCGWDYDTYLDNVLEGTLDGDNYTTEEQEYLLSPVWKQVEKDHPEFKNYPPNTDVEDDILMRASGSDYPIGDIDNPVYQFLVVDTPTLEGHPIINRTLSFEHFGLRPITDEMIVDMLNEEWSEEIRHDQYLHEHFIISDDEWYGVATRLYDEYGILVHNLNESVYHITDHDLLRINVSSKLSRIVKNPIEYNLD